MNDMESINILGVRIDKVTMAQTLDLISEWFKSDTKRYIVTTNVEFVMAAQDNKEFRDVLNNADLSIPDSSRFGWAKHILEEKNPIIRLLLWPFFTLPRSSFIKPFPVTTGTDLMEKIARQFSKTDHSIGLIGGNKGVAERAAECLKAKYPTLNIAFALEGPKVRVNGEPEKPQSSNLIYKDLPRCSILFVAFGHVKQELWIKKHMQEINAKVFIGVGGAFDYIAGKVPRATKFLRDLGLEWLFRLIIQPWRIKRFGSLTKFVFMILFNKREA